MTIWKFKSDIRALFSGGQAYTALSRGTSLEGLSIMHLDRPGGCVHSGQGGCERAMTIGSTNGRFENMRTELRGN